MIPLTRLNGNTMYINPDLIKMIEQNGDTRITFINNSLIVVKEEPQKIAQLMLEYKRTIFRGVNVT